MAARILIVEDNRVVARDLSQQLAAIGHTVVAIVARGEDAVTQTREGRADLVLMDIRLEGRTDGITAAAEVRDQCRVPVIFLTAYADEPTLRRALRAEPFGYVLKPFDDLQLRTVIDMALSKAATERHLRASERRFVTTLSSIGDAVVATDEQGLVAFMNPTAEAMLGRSQLEAAGSAFAELLTLTEEGTGRAIEDPAAEALLSRSAVTQQDARLRIIGERELSVTYSAAPILDDGGVPTGAVLVFSDQTERRATAERLGQARAALDRAARLMTMGELAASIAHEVNQPLMAAVTNADACVRWLAAAPTPNVEEATLAARRIVQNGHRAAEVIRSIRALARNTPPRVSPVVLVEIVDEVFALVRMEAGRTGVVVGSSVDRGLPPVLADPVQLRQVILNLVLNGMEAQAAQDSERKVQVDASLPTPDMVVVNVADLGPGFDPALTDRLFDPLFTTKAEGMGLGLSICRSIIEAHGGNIGVAPRQLRGTVFHFTLPVASGDMPEAPSMKPRSEL